MSDDLPMVLRKNGTVILDVGGDRITLRYPKSSQYAALAEAHYDMGEELMALTTEIEVRCRDIDREIVDLGGRNLSKPPAEQGPVDEYALPEDVRQKITGLRSEQRRVRADANGRVHRLQVAWMHQAIDLLRTKAGPVPDDDDLPQWMANPQTTTAMIEHWQTTPLARGGA